MTAMLVATTAAIALSAATDSCGDANGNCDGDRLLATGWSKCGRVVAVALQGDRLVTGWSKLLTGRVVAVAIMMVPWAAIDCLVLADLNGDE